MRANLVDDAVPCEARVVDDDVDLAVAEFRRFLDECVDVRAVKHVARYGDGTAAGLVDLLGYCFRFLCGGATAVSDTCPARLWSMSVRTWEEILLTGIYILHDDFGTFVCE